jgi:ERCC4-type nuclease
MAQPGEVIELLDSDGDSEAERAPSTGTIDLCESSDDDTQKVVALTLRQPPPKAVSSLHHTTRKRKVSLSQSSSVKPSSRRSSLLQELSSSSSNDDDDDDDLLVGGPIFSNRKFTTTPTPPTAPARMMRTSQYDPLVLGDGVVLEESPARTLYPAASASAADAAAAMRTNPYAATATSHTPRANPYATCAAPMSTPRVNPYATSAAPMSTPRANPYATSAAPMSTPRANPYATSAATSTSRPSHSPNADIDVDEDEDADLWSGGLSIVANKPAAAPTISASACTTHADADASHNARLPTPSSSRIPPAAASAAASQYQNQQQQQYTDRDRDIPYIYPTLLANSKQYSDERARFALAFWKFARSQTARSYQRPKLHTQAKRAVELALTEFPVRSLEEYMHFGSISSVTGSIQVREELRSDLDAGKYNTVQTPVTGETSVQRRYYTIAEACLSALLQHVERTLRRNGESPDMLRILDDAGKQEYLEKDKDMWVSLEDLIPAVDNLLRPECPGKLTRSKEADNGAAHYLEQSTRSAEFMQIAKMECVIFGPLIKRRKWKGLCHFELLPAGYKSACMIRTRNFPEPPGHYRCSPIATHSHVPDQFKGVCLGVDRNEGGGGAKMLHQMCQKLDMKKVPYFVGTLQIGDYVFFSTKDGGKTTGGPMDYLCPIIVERKSVQDVAMSIHDGRWSSQKRRMYQGQYVFGYENCRMVYIIEGNQNAQTVSGGYVGARWYDVNKERLAEEVENLKAEGFEVLQTPSRENTMFELARWAERIATELKNGTLKVQYTYAEFKREVAKIGPTVDFSRLAKDYMETTQEQEALKRSAAETRVDSNSQSSPMEKAKGNGSASSDLKPSGSAKKQKTDDEKDEYSDYTTKELQEACKTAALTKSGTRKVLLERLRGPHPPKLWLQRKQKGEFVPVRHNVGGSALLVALHIYEREVGHENAGIIKEDLYTKAEELNITKNPFSGGTTQTGPYHYDGWSNMAQLLIGDPALVIKKKNKFKLTSSNDIAGQAIAKAIHTWNHEHENCPCGNPN